MCMHPQEVLFQIRSIKKPVIFLKMIVKNCFHYNMQSKKLFETYYSLKKLSTSPKNGNPPIKNNGPSLI